MTTTYYRGDGSAATPEVPIDLPISHRLRLLRPENYLADGGLVKAVNVALMLG